MRQVFAACFALPEQKSAQAKPLCTRQQPVFEQFSFFEVQACRRKSKRKGRKVPKRGTDGRHGFEFRQPKRGAALVSLFLRIKKRRNAAEKDVCCRGGRKAKDSKNRRKDQNKHCRVFFASAASACFRRCRIYHVGSGNKRRLVSVRRGVCGGLSARISPFGVHRLGTRLTRILRGNAGAEICRCGVRGVRVPGGT